MMSWSDFWTVAMPQIAILCVVVVLSGLVIMKFSEPLVVSINGLEELPYLEGDVRDFVMIGERYAANHEYVNGSFNCVNYSRGLKAISDELGFDTFYVEGCPGVFNGTNRTCHAWLRLVIDFEPISGELTDYSKAYPDIRKEER